MEFNDLFDIEEDLESKLSPSKFFIRTKFAF